MNKLFVAGIALLVLAGCDKPADAPVQTPAQPKVASVPTQNGQYLRFNQLENGETRLELHRVVGKVSKVISGYPGFTVEPGKFPDVNPLSVRIQNCGLITFRKSTDGAVGMTAERTDASDFNDQCPIQNLDGLWVPLTAGA
ncbi:hypothetical protein JVX91_00810 [Pseudomonas sp. PDNC002]|uniref:hypothetical protein n=1 Tax=Pseudomonas sp. PDNC002 TaxID=2811422 RepID=UPI001966CE2E|nr:hypothetical protein [Pseudomonas sp. PDNC002]QRY79686.1 hypothetical protein JVX91_00810 [Pseudomonas sp. PDNC002]